MRYKPGPELADKSIVWLIVAVVATLLLIAFFGLVIYWHKYKDGHLMQSTWKQPDQL
jgi:hypothetical protein